MSDAEPIRLIASEPVRSDTIPVLCVDDEPEFLDLTRTVLERDTDRLEISTETSARDAIDRLRDERFQCVVSDYEMPGMTGLELLERVREESPDIPFILFTGKGSEEIASEAISKGVTDYIQKGGTETYVILENKIRTVASEYRTRRDLAWYRAAIEATQDAVYVRDAENRFVAVNDSFTELTGYDPERVLGSQPSLIKEPPGVEAVERHIEALRRPDGPEDVVFEVSVHPERGDPIPCEDHMSAIRSNTGTFLGTVGALRDISQRKAREQTMRTRLRQQEIVAHLGEFATERRDLDALMDEVVERVAEGLRADYCKVLELRPDEDDLLLRAGVGWKDGYVGTATVGTERDSQAGYTLLQEQPVVVRDLATEERFDGPELLTDHDVTSGISVLLGSPDDVWGILGVHDTAYREFNEHDIDFVRSVGHVLESAVERRDVERRLEELNDQLRQRNEQFGTFASVLSHDLKNPLGIALGRLELARTEDDTESLDAAERSISRAVDLVDDLTETMQSGVIRDELTDCDVGAMARKAWETVGTSEGTLEVADPPTVEADSGALLRLFENLVRNAIEHDDESVSVTVGRLADGFYVSDDGPGIPEDERDSVFEAGYSTKEDGTGFGLLSVKQIVRAHGWEMALAESSRGGARFEISGVTIAEEST